jgi:hypothetical protein
VEHQSSSGKRRIKARQIVFLPFDYWHLFLSFIAGLIALPMSIVSLAISLVYVAYQITEKKEDEFRTVRDLVMFLVGFLLGFQVFLTCSTLASKPS